MTTVEAKTSETKVKLELPDIARKLKGLTLPDVDAVIGIATGGVAFATMVAFWLEKPLHIIHLNYRDENNHPRHAKPKLLKPFDINPTTFNKGIYPLANSELSIIRGCNPLEPQRAETFETNDSAAHLLLVDDVSVTGSTLETAKKFLPDYITTTLVIKGKADFVLYPDVRACILLPWRDV
jgi:hypoxanthine phosphoribosyltransferase